MNTENFRKQLEAFNIDTWEGVNNSSKVKRIFKCDCCGSLGYGVPFTEDGSTLYTPPFQWAETLDGRMFCEECLGIPLITQEYADKLDEEDGFTNDKYLDSKERIAPRRGRYTVEELRREQHYWLKKLKEFLLSNDIDTYNTYKDLIEETLQNYENGYV